MKNKDFFRSPSKGRMDLKKVVEEICNFINQDAESKYELVVGTDSSGTQKTDFITAIIAYRIGKGGCYFWKKINGQKTYVLRDRIYEEVTISLKTAEEMLGFLNSQLKTKTFPEYNFQIHVDVGQNGKTKEMIKEVVGMVKGNGFKVKIKPYSYAASNVADRYA